MTGQSSWSAFFLDERVRYLRTKLASASAAEAAEINRQMSEVTAAQKAERALQIERDGRIEGTQVPPDGGNVDGPVGGPGGGG